MKINRIVVATNNQGKLREIRKMLEPYLIEVLSLKDINIEADIEETGKTFEENAEIKAEAVMKLCNLPTIADDSGLSVDALDGAPGVYSARYAGENKTDTDRINKLLLDIKGVPEEKRGAEFVSALCFKSPDGRGFVVTGKCRGVITFEPKGENGFGYDPIFYVPGLNKTFAELPDDVKNQISHRANAMKLFLKKFNELI